MKNKLKGFIYNTDQIIEDNKIVRYDKSICVFDDKSEINVNDYLLKVLSSDENYIIYINDLMVPINKKILIKYLVEIL